MTNTHTQIHTDIYMKFISHTGRKRSWDPKNSSEWVLKAKCFCYYFSTYIFYFSSYLGEAEKHALYLFFLYFLD